MAFMLAHSPAISETRRILVSGVLGAMTLARFHIPGPVGATREPALSLPDDLGGIFYADGSHAVHLIIRFLGLPRRVTAMLLRLPEGPPVVAQDYIRDAYTQETVVSPSRRHGPGRDLPLRTRGRGGSDHRRVLKAGFKTHAALAMYPVIGMMEVASRKARVGVLKDAPSLLDTQRLGLFFYFSFFY
jgi:hypothetical protein